jgi:hypothetical protein
VAHGGPRVREAIELNEVTEVPSGTDVVFVFAMLGI